MSSYASLSTSPTVGSSSSHDTTASLELASKSWLQKKEGTAEKSRASKQEAITIKSVDGTACISCICMFVLGDTGQEKDWRKRGLCWKEEKEEWWWWWQLWAASMALGVCSSWVFLLPLYLPSFISMSHRLFAFFSGVICETTLIYLYSISIYHNWHSLQ